jgi:hypothetical protein
VLVYSDNWQELVVPPELNEILSGQGGGDLLNPLNPLNPQGPASNTSDAQNQMQFSQPVVTEFNRTERTLKFSFNFTNPVALDFELESFSGTVQCKEHKVVLGIASLDGAITVKASQTTEVSVKCTWTAEGENHFLSAHSGASTMDVQLVNTTVNLSGIEIQLTDPIDVPNVPLGLI